MRENGSQEDGRAAVSSATTRDTPALQGRRMEANEVHFPLGLGFVNTDQDSLEKSKLRN